MLPLRDNAPSRTTSWIVVALVALNTIAFAAQSLCGVDAGRLLGLFGLIPSRFLGWTALGGVATDPWRYLPLASAMFLHDGWIHLASNMVYLWVFGRALEGRLGRVGLAGTFVLSGVAAGLGQIIAHPHSNAAMIGASGAVAGLLGAYLVCFPRAKLTLAFPFYFVPFVLELRAVWFLLAWFALQVGHGAADLMAATTEPHVAWWAHATGFVTGMIGAVAGRGWVPLEKPAPGVVTAPAPPRVSLGPQPPGIVLRPSRVPAAPPGLRRSVY